MKSAMSPENVLHIISRLMVELHPEAGAAKDIHLDSRLDRDLGLDSLARMELLTRLEKEIGAHLPEKALISAETVRDLLRQLDSTGTDKISRPFTADTAASGTLRQQTGATNAQTLMEVLEQQVQVQPETEHILLLEGEKTTSISYGQLRQQAMAVAARMHDLQLEPAEPVAIMLPTGVDYFFTFLGVLYAGGIPVPLYPPARPTQVEEHVRRHRKIIGNAGASILVTMPQVKPVARLLMSQLPELQHIVTTDDLYRDGTNHPIPRLKNSDIAFLQYTSGSTGDPKGVILSHANLLANVRAMGRVCQVTPEDVFVSWLPLYHDMGLIGAWLGSLCHSCRLVIMSPLSFLGRPIRWLRTIDTYRGTLSASPNFGYDLCCNRLDDKDLEGLDLSSWRYAFNGAEPVIPETLFRFRERMAEYGLKPETLAPVYGLAESSVGLAFPPPGRGIVVDRIERETFMREGKALPAKETHSGTMQVVNCGRPLPKHQVRIVDSSDRELPERQQGRLQFKGPSSTTGYYRNPQETEKLYDGDWLETGDLAYISGGDIYITSRAKDIIIRGGRNIYPHELEDAVNGIDGIRTNCTAAFGSKDQSGGTENLVILCESRHSKKETLDRLKQEIIQVTTDLLGLPPDTIVIARPGSVLKTSSGKIRRSACRELYEKNLIGKEKTAVWLQLIRMGLAGVIPLLHRLSNRLLSTLYAAYCWMLFGITGMTLWCSLMILPKGSAGWTLTAGAVRLLGRLTAISIHVSGRDNIPTSGKYLFACNHMSYMDSILLTAALPEQVNYVAKAELAGVPLMGGALKKLGVFFVERFDAEQGLADTRDIAKGIKKGLRPFFFVEGTLQRMPGLLPFQMGAFVLAAEEDVAVVPVVLRGSRNILRAESLFPRRGVVQITFLPPQRPQSSDWKGAVSLRDTVRKAILKQVAEPDLSSEYTSLKQLAFRTLKQRDSNLDNENSKTHS